MTNWSKNRAIRSRPTAESLERWRKILVPRELSTRVVIVKLREKNDNAESTEDEENLEG